jgi:hypothetical protein
MHAFTMLALCSILGYPLWQIRMYRAHGLLVGLVALTAMAALPVGTAGLRVGGRHVTLPPPSFQLSDGANVTQFWATQRVDHFNPQDRSTVSERQGSAVAE